MIDVAIETSAGTKLGSGPPQTVQSFTVRHRLDQIGTVALEMAATEDRAALFAPNTLPYVRAHAMLADDYVEVGHGLIKKRDLDSDGGLGLSGPTILGELQHYRVKRLVLEDPSAEGEPMPAADVPAAIIAFAPGWTITGVPSKDVFLKFGDESIDNVVAKVCDTTGDHWRLDPTTPRQIEILPTTADGFEPTFSGVTAIDQGDGYGIRTNNDVCLIVGELQEVADGNDRVTRLLLRGGGNADAQLFINGTDRFSATTTPGDYTSGDYTIHIDADPAQSYIAHDPSEVGGDIIEGVEVFRDIAPIRDRAADTLSARNALVDAGLVALKRRIVEQRSYRFRVTNVRKPLYVGDSIHLRCRHFVGAYGWMNVNEKLLLLEVAPAYTAEGGEPEYTLQTTQIAVDRWPVTEQQTIATVAKVVQSLTSHVQVAERAMTSAAIASDVAVTPIIARYTQASAQSMPNATVSIVNYDTQTDDTAAAVTTGAAWAFTVPVTGYYDVSAAIMYQATATWAAGEVAWLAIYVAGTRYSYLDRKDSVATPAQYMQLSGSDVVYAVAGTEINIRTNQASGGALTLFADDDYNYVTIRRVV